MDILVIFIYNKKIKKTHINSKKMERQENNLIWCLKSE